MARATIPYDELNEKARELFPKPTYEYVSVQRPNRYNSLKAPTTVYDRSTGNYQKIGYRCLIKRRRLGGFTEDFQPIWISKGSYVILEI